MRCNKNVWWGTVRTICCFGGWGDGEEGGWNSGCWSSWRGEILLKRSSFPNCCFANCAYFRTKISTVGKIFKIGWSTEPVLQMGDQDVTVQAPRARGLCRVCRRVELGPQCAASEGAILRSPCLGPLPDALSTEHLQGWWETHLHIY